MPDDVSKIWRIIGKRVDDGVSEFIALFIPRSLLEMVRCVLNKARHDVLAPRRNGGICQTWNDDIDVRALRVTSVFPVIVSVLDVFQAWRNRNCYAQVLKVAG